MRRLLGAVVIGVVAVIAFQQAREQPADEPAALDDAERFPLVVDRVLDGDSLVGRIDGRDVEVRLVGIDTPEGTPTVECWADEARERLRDLVEGRDVGASYQEEKEDRYGRQLLDLWTTDGDHVQSLLVGGGDAEALVVGPNDHFYDALVALEDDAREAGRGQWGSC